MSGPNGRAVRFLLEDVDGFARFLVALERAGAAYEVERTVDGWTVRVTGY